MAKQFKPVCLSVLIGAMALMLCGAAVFYSHRTAHGTTAEERAAYELGEKAGERAPRGATLPMEAELNMTAQKYFEQQGPAEQLQILREQPTCRLLKRVTLPGSRRTIRSNEASD